MVSLDVVQASNARIASTLPAGLVAVFVGGTNGIGEYTVKQLAKHAVSPRICLVGRSREAADRIIAECQTLNSAGQYHFLQADVSIIRNVDSICRDIKRQENAINLLFLTQGTLAFGTKTEEGLHYPIALAYFSRMRFIENLLPQLKSANQLRRVVSVFCGTKEGALNTADMQGWNVKNPMKARAHGASLVTLGMERLAKAAPQVSFIHDFPGPVKSGIGRGTSGVLMAVLMAVSALIGPLFNIPTEESGERHLYVATSARYPALKSEKDVSGVSLDDGIGVAIGTDGQSGSGMYSVDQNCEEADATIVAVLEKLRAAGDDTKIQEFADVELKRIFGEGAK